MIWQSALRKPQLRVRYGPDAARAILALAGTKIVLGGNSDAEIAEEISKLTGMYGGRDAPCPSSRLPT